MQICDAGLWNYFYSDIFGKFHKYYKVTKFKCSGLDQPIRRSVKTA